MNRPADHSPNEETAAAIRDLEAGQGTVFDGSTDDFIKMMLEDSAAAPQK